MRRLALRGALRRGLARLHRWSGLAVMACLLVASVTGVWLVFREEIDRTLNARLRVVRPGPTRLAEDQIVTLVEARFPGAMASLVQFTERRDEAVALSLTSRNPESRVRFDSVYVNPYTGEILGQRRSARDGLSLESLNALILRVHHTLLADEWGRRLMGSAAIVWLVTNLIGLALSWPRVWGRLRSWLPLLSVRTSGSAYKANYQLHRAGALWLLPVLTVLAFTSVALNLPQYVRPLVLAFSSLSRLPPGQRVNPQEVVVTFNEANAAVHRMFPQARTTNIYRDLAGGRYSVYFHLPEDINPQGDDFALVDVGTGQVVAVRRPAKSTAGDRFIAWLFPLHTGAAFGWPGRLLVAIAGIMTIVLNATGLYVWWVKWRMRRRHR